MGMRLRRVFLLAAVTALLLAPVRPAGAAAQIVVPLQQPTIQAAVNAARAGDTIVVRSGVFTEQVTIGKDLTITGAGAASTTIQAPAVLAPRVIGPLPGRANVVEVYGGARVTMQSIGVSGPAGDDCPGLTGVSVQDGATLRLQSASIRGCTVIGLFVGYPSDIPVGPEVGHAIVSAIEVTGALAYGIRAGGPGTTVSVTGSTVVMPPVAEFGGFGIAVFEGQGVFRGNTVRGAICTTCGDNFITENFGVGVVAFDAAPGTVISQNTMSGNDVGLIVGASSGCCQLTQNTLKDNRFYGLVVFDADETLSQSTITGGLVGAAAISFDSPTTLTLDRVVISGATTPVQAVSCCGQPANVVQRSVIIR